MRIFNPLAAAITMSMLAVAPAFADSAPLPMIGVGVAIPLSGTVGGTIYVPVNLHEKVRVEAGIGLLNASKSTTTTPTGGTAITSSSSASTIGISVGAFFMMRPTDTFVGYVGPRIGIGMGSSASDDGATPTAKTTKTSSTDVLVALAIGGEHFLAKQFSLGAEAAIGMAMLGQPKTEVTPAPAAAPAAVTESQSLMSTGGTLFARFYF